MKEAILVTGGAGFIGSHLCERLLHEGYEVVCLDNFDTFYDPQIKRQNLASIQNHPRFHLVEGDIRDAPLVEQVFREFPIQRVFHGAARAGVRPSIQDPFLYEAVNIRGTLSLLQAAGRHGIAQFVFASSSSVYGARQKVPFSEAEPADHPVSPYAATKRAGELLCYTAHHLYGFPVTCLRFFTVYGPRQRPEMAIHRFVARLDRGEPIPVYGDGTSRRDFTYIDDAIEGISRALFRPYPYEIINLGESRTVSLLELIRILERIMGKKAQILHLPPQPGDVPITYADVSRARDLLGYEPQTPIEEGLARFVAWYREQKRRDP